MINRLVIDVKTSEVFDADGFPLGRVGETRSTTNTDNAMVYMTVNLIIPAQNFRRIADAKVEKPTVERTLRF